MPTQTKIEDPDLENNSVYDKSSDIINPDNKKNEDEAARKIVDGPEDRLIPSQDYVDNTIAQMENQFNDNPKDYSPIKNTFNKAKSWIKGNPKKSGGLGLGMLGVGVGAYLGIIASGPLQIIHFANMLQSFHFSQMDTVSANRIRNLINYSKWAQGKGGLENTRLGNIEAHKAKKIDAKLAKSGISSSFDPDTGKFRGFDIDVDNLPEDLKNKVNETSDVNQKRKILAEFFNVSPDNIPSLDGSDGKKFNISVEGTRENRQLMSKILDISPDFNKATAAMAKRILVKRANVSYNPYTKAREALKTKFAEARQKRLQGKAIDVSKQIPRPVRDVSDDIPDSQRREIEDINNGNSNAEEFAKDLIANPDQDPEAFKARLSRVAKAGAGPLVVVGLACMVKEVSETVGDAQMQNKLVPMIQSAGDILSVSSKIMDGRDIDLEAVGEISNNLNSEDSSWSSATSIQAEQGQLSPEAGKTLSNFPELDPSQKSNAQGLNELLGEAGLVNVGLDVACGVMNWVDDATGFIVDVVSFGQVDKIEEATIGKLFNLMISTLVGESIDISTYRGAPFGEATNVGGRLMANESALSMGGSFLSDQAAYENRQYIAKYEEKTLGEKYFDIYNPQSVAGSLAFQTSTSKNASQIASLPSNILSRIGSIFSPKTYASTMVSSDQYYGIPAAGFSISKLDSIENPYQNAIEVRQLLESNPGLIEKFEKCTGVRIEMTSTDLDFVSKSFDENVVGQYVGNEDMIKDCSEEANPELYKVRVLALDTTLLKSFSCLEYEDEQSCSEIGVNYSTSDVNSGSAGNANRPTASKADQIKAILANPRVKWGNFGSADSQKIEVQNFLTGNAVSGLLMMAEQSGVDIPLNSLYRPAESGSDHSTGKAIDVGYYGNGQAQHKAEGDKLYNYLYDNYKELRISQLIWQEPPAGKKCIGNNGNDVSEVDCYQYYSDQTMNGHYNHIHIGFLPDNAGDSR